MQPSRREYEQRKEQERQDMQDRFRVVAGVLNFLGVVLGVVAIFLLLALLFSLISWLSQDVSSTFSILRTRLQ